MNKWALTLVALALGACAEVTRFNTGDGGGYYHIDCGNGLQIIESCKLAVRRTCPNGYYKIDKIPASQGEADSQYTRCLQDNQERRQNRQPMVACSRKPGNEGFFACK